MILTVTLNASVDKLYLLPSIQPETVMRVHQVHNTAGGKGLNVSRVAAKLGEKVIAMGFTGGMNGRYFESLMTEPEIEAAFTRVKAETRCCINCWDMAAGRSAEYLEPGAEVSCQEVDRFFDDFDSRLSQASVVVISGSAPQGVPDDAYDRMIRRCKEAGIYVILDTSGKRLVHAVTQQPDLVKPNQDEIGLLAGSVPQNRSDQIAAVVKLHELGIAYAALSLGSEGVLLSCDKGVYEAYPPYIIPQNTVGCGDSMVAGFAVGLSRGLPIEELLRVAVAVSAANALSLYTGDFNKLDYEALYPQVYIKKID